MNIQGIETDSMLNGDGLRVVLWVSGCSHHCKGCQNPQTWDPESGVLFMLSHFEKIWFELKKDYISGITYSGGDPLHVDNRDMITFLARNIYLQFPKKTQWLYTGYRFEEVSHLPVMQYIDVLVDGRYEESLRDISLPWVGSSNQRVIDVQKSLKEGKTICMDLQ